MYDIIIIGGGTAGLTAGIYAVRAGKTALVLESKAFGGQIINTPEIENYPGLKNVSGFEFAMNLHSQATDLGVKSEYDKVVSLIDDGEIKTVVTENAKYQCKSIILATGAKNRTLGLENEEDLIGMGVSYCATCDGAFFRGKDTAIVGGGNTAFEDALFLSHYCSKVYVIHRRDKFRGEEKLLERLSKRENVELVLDSVPTKLIAKINLDAVEVENVKTKEKREIPISGLFVAIGQIPDNKSFENLVELDKGGYIVSGEDCKTKTPGVFTAGDCRTKTVRQLTTAAGDGAVAGLAACEYIDSL